MWDSQGSLEYFEVTHEGIKMVRIPTLQMLTLRFKEIRMLKDESFNEFYTKLNDIINFTFNLGEKLEDSWIVRKILRSLP
jgi:hypothetical protein